MALYGLPRRTGYGTYYPSTPTSPPRSPKIPNQVVNMNLLAVIIEQNKEMIELLTILVEKMGHGFD